LVKARKRWMLSCCEAERNTILSNENMLAENYAQYQHDLHCTRLLLEHESRMLKMRTRQLREHESRMLKRRTRTKQKINVKIQATSHIESEFIAKRRLEIEADRVARASKRIMWWER
jgi:hypothetical protein